MKRLNMVFLVALVVAFFISVPVFINTASAGLVNVADPLLTHFGTFYNEAGEYSNISLNEATGYGAFGWHTHNVNYPAYGGILLDEGHIVTELRLQVHYNPFSGFVLQGSTDTTTGLDGTWTDIASGTVAHAQTELTWNEWTFSNTASYSAYRIKMSGDYAGGWAMYRWQLLEDDSASPVPEPASMILLGSGLAGLVALRRRAKRA